MLIVTPFYWCWAHPRNALLDPSLGSFSLPQRKALREEGKVTCKEGPCQKFMVRVSSSCSLEGVGCQCFLPSQPWACFGLFLYFPSALPTPPVAPHLPQLTPRRQQSLTPQQLGWPAPPRADMALQAPGHHRASTNNGKIVFTGSACRPHTSILLLKENTTTTTTTISVVS